LGQSRFKEMVGEQSVVLEPDVRGLL
jgi:hypothetical protein